MTRDSTQAQGSSEQQVDGCAGFSRDRTIVSNDVTTESSINWRGSNGEHGQR